MIPAFRRSSVDGYAVCSKDTAGATESIPVFLKVLEEVEIGHPAVSKIEPGTCAYVPTGGMVPEGADAMVMVEYSERFGTDEVALYENVPYGKCIVLPGEDVKTGDIVLKAGTRIGPAQAGTLAALGVVQVPVFKPWKVAVLSTGDELVRIDQVPGPGQVRDINTWALSCYVKKTGLELVSAEAVRDEEVLLEEKIREAVKACDLILISGGSSQGKKDMTMEILNRISKEGVFTHGLALKPGKPTILGYDKEKNTLLGGLPGHPQIPAGPSAGQRPGGPGHGPGLDQRRRRDPGSGSQCDGGLRKAGAHRQPGQRHEGVCPCRPELYPGQRPEAGRSRGLL